MNVDPIFKEALEGMKTSLPPVPTRYERQHQIENLLANFHPDALEAQEILAAFTAGLKGRFDEDRITDVLDEIKRLEEALEELERTTCGPDNGEDEAYENWRARQE